MKKFSVACCALFALTIAASGGWIHYVAPFLGCSTERAIDLYQQNARTPIFSGFITMGSFLLALKTNILGRLKETYDTPEYRCEYRADRKNNGVGEKKKYYESLERLSEALGWNIFLCFLTALFQMTLGFVYSFYSPTVCMGFAIGCLMLLMYLTFILMRTHQEWFDLIEGEMQKKITALDQENDSQKEI